jgi:hypothetical protein
MKARFDQPGYQTYMYKQAEDLLLIENHARGRCQQGISLCDRLLW